MASAPSTPLQLAAAITSLCTTIAYARANTATACEGQAPHGFADQEAEVAAGIARFIGGDKY